jgi:hypothetical protein
MAPKSLLRIHGATWLEATNITQKWGERDVIDTENRRAQPCRTEPVE